MNFILSAIVFELNSKNYKIILICQISTQCNTRRGCVIITKFNENYFFIVKNKMGVDCLKYLKKYFVYINKNHPNTYIISAIYYIITKILFIL